MTTRQKASRKKASRKKAVQSAHTTKILEKVLYHNQSNDKDYYSYIQANGTDIALYFINAFKKAIKLQKPYRSYTHQGKIHYAYEEIRILDVGSGLGGALLQMKGAYHLLQNSFKKKRCPRAIFDGLEVDKNLAQISRKQNVYAYLQDALTFKNYNKYDIIYYYHPIKNHDLQLELETKIEKEAKVGAIIIAFLKAGKPKMSYKNYNFPSNFKIITKKDTYEYNGNYVIQKVKT